MLFLFNSHTLTYTLNGKFESWDFHGKFSGILHGQLGLGLGLGLGSMDNNWTLIL